MIKVIGLTLGLLLTLGTQAAEFDWGELKRKRIDLQLPHMTVQGDKGLLACAYVDIDTCNKTGEACAIVSGVKNHDEMLNRPVIQVSDTARKLGIEPGMTGIQALEILR
jgi:uncharacterized protein YunC (DUF1805 family)